MFEALANGAIEIVNGSRVVDRLQDASTPIASSLTSSVGVAQRSAQRHSDEVAQAIRKQTALQTDPDSNLDRLSEMTSEDKVSSERLLSALRPNVRERERGLRPQASFNPLQEWEGYVTQIDEEVFYARLLDMTARKQVEQEEVKLPISDVSFDDLALLSAGAVFRWVIGYQREPGGTKKRVSQIVFRRMPRWTPNDFAAAKAEASRLFEALNPQWG